MRTTTNPAVRFNPANRFWGDRAVPTSKAEFFNAVTTPSPIGEGTVATIRMYGPIDSWGGYWGISTKDIGEVLDALPDSVTQIILRINSPGGEVWEGVSILNMFRAHKATVTAVVDGLAASAASFIAAGCDETVMSPGTQMMIHSPSGFTWGNATELRKDADFLDTIEASIIEIYTEKAGEKDWTGLLAAETWLTAPQSVELGLADRVAIVPDAGEAATVGEDDTVLIVPIEIDDPEDTAAQNRAVPLRARATALAPRTPSAAASGEPNPEEKLIMSDAFTAGVRDRLGVTDANASEETLLAALDEALAEQPDPTPTNTLPKGTVQVDAKAFDELRAQAALGAQARAQQESDRRDAIVATAVREGRISPNSSAQWREQLNTAEASITAVLQTLPANTVPVTEIGVSDGPTDADTSLYAMAWGDDSKGA